MWKWILIIWLALQMTEDLMISIHRLEIRRKTHVIIIRNIIILILLFLSGFFK